MTDHYYSQSHEEPAGHKESSGSHGGGHDSGHGGGSHGAHGTVHDLPAQSQEMKEIDKAFQIGVDELGTTTNPFEHQTSALKARIFHGASRIEFSFFGAQKGRKEQPTPETFGRRERLDMRELAEFNEVETTTHASVGVQGLSGLNMQQGNFSDDQRKQAIDEIKRAISFAADATTGGAVVFHTSEAPRYMHGRWKDNTGKSLFEMYPEENIRKVTYLVDPLSKKLVAQIHDIDKVSAPKFKKDEKGEILYLKDENGKEVFDPQLSEFDRIHKGKTPLYEVDKEGNIQTELITFSDFRDRRIKDLQRQGETDLSEKRLVKDFYYQQRFVDVMYSLYFGIAREKEYSDGLKHREKLIEAKKFYHELKQKIPEKDHWKLQKEYRKYAAEGLGLVPMETIDPETWLEQELKENARQISHNKELALHGRRTVQEQLDVVQRAELADQFAIKESAKSMADLGVYAWQMTEKAHRDYKDGKAPFDIKNPIYLAPENLFPEMYGSHPDELETFVKEGRSAMAKELQSKYGMKGEEASKLAKEHIKATFDIGHANVWRKYFVSNPGESLESRDKRFNEWLLKKTQDLVDRGIIGHVHISDNFGIHDEHLAAGDGNAPIKDFIKQAKASGLKEFIVESGSFNPLTSLPDTWMHFDSPVYGLHVPGFTKDAWTDPSIPRAWNDFYRSYFGRTEGPRYLVGDTSPSEDFKGAPFYSGISME